MADMEEKIYFAGEFDAGRELSEHQRLATHESRARLGRKRAPLDLVGPTGLLRQRRQRQELHPTVGQYGKPQAVR